MRQLLIDNARRKRRPKHGGDRQRHELDENALAFDGPTDDVLALDEAITKLATENTEKAELAKLRCYAGLSIDAAAATLGVSRATAVRYWTYARAWLYQELHEDDQGDG